MPPFTPRSSYNFVKGDRSNVFRIRTANILLITLRGLGNEIAKNLILSGIGSLTLLDNAQIQPKDLSAQFLISEENMQQNVRFPRLTFHAFLGTLS